MQEFQFSEKAPYKTSNQLHPPPKQTNPKKNPKQTRYAEWVATQAQSRPFLSTPTRSVSPQKYPLITYQVSALYQLFCIQVMLIIRWMNEIEPLSNKLKQKFPENITCSSTNLQQIISGFPDLCLTQKENIPEYKVPEKLQLYLRRPIVKYCPHFLYKDDWSFRNKVYCFYLKIVSDTFWHSIMHLHFRKHLYLNIPPDFYEKNI